MQIFVLLYSRLQTSQIGENEVKKKNKRVKLNGQIETSASKEEAWEEINKR